MDADASNGRFGLSVLFWLIGFVVVLLLNANGRLAEKGGGFSINGLETYQKYSHGFPAKIALRIVVNRESRTWRFWDGDEFELDAKGIGLNSLALVGIIALMILLRRKIG